MLQEKGYMRFVESVREYINTDGFSTHDAVKKAMDKCISDGVLKDFFTERYDEVMKVVELDYTFERRLELQREEAENAGIQKGEELLASLIDKLIEIGKSEDIPKATKDPVYRERLYFEYGIKE